MSKHTPGPWYVRHEYNVYFKDSCVASCGGYQTTSDSEKNHLTKCANALLIAASVDLLEACKSLIWCFDRGLPQGSIGEKICIEAKATIAKAEGNEDA